MPLVILAPMFPDTVVRDGKAGSAQSALLIWLFQQPAYKQAIVISIYVNMDFAGIGDGNLGE